MFSADLSHFVCSVRIPTWCAFESYGISLQLNPGFSHLYKRVQIFFFLFLMFNFSLSLIFDVLRLHVFSLILLCKFNKPHFFKEGGGVETPWPLSSRSAHELRLLSKIFFDLNKNYQSGYNNEYEHYLSFLYIQSNNMIIN